MKISEEEYKRFFDPIRFRNVPLPSTGEVFQMPLITLYSPYFQLISDEKRLEVIEL